MKPDTSPIYYRPKKNELPSHARRLTHDEVFQLQMARIQKSKDPELFTLKYGCEIMSASCAFSSLAILLAMRKPFRLGGYGLIFSSIPTVSLALGPSYVFTNILVLQKMLTGQVNKCVECTQLRAAGIQVGTGVIYPAICSTILTFGMVRKYQTAPLPVLYPFSEFRKNVVKCFLRPALSNIVLSSIFHTVIACVIVQKQYNGFLLMMNTDPSLVHTN